MKPIVLTRTEGDALDAIETDQIREPIALVRDAGLDPSYFFEFGRWLGGDFTRSDISGVSFRGANLHGAVFRPDQIPIVMATNPRRGPCDDIVRDEIEPEALEAFLEARRRIAIAEASGKDELSLSIVALDRLPPEIAVLSDIKILDLNSTQVEDISPLAGMTAMRTLYLSRTKVEDISHLAGMTAMQTLGLSGTRVEDISPLAGMTAMQTLGLNGTKMEDFSPLAGMTAMQTLSLSGTKVEDISHVAGMTAMQELDLNRTKVEDISPLAGMTAMQTLYLGSTRVQDISHLAGMTEMQELDLNRTKVEDISHLAGMTEMQTLYLSDTKAELHQLVAEGVAWAEEDHVLRSLEFANTPVTQSGECLEGVYEASKRRKDRTKAALAALRAERDRRKAEESAPPNIPPAPAHGHIFLSYSREDASTAQLLRDALEQDGVTIWQDVDMALSSRFRGEIDDRIASAAAVLVLWSDASTVSEYVQSEAERARQADKLTPALLAPLTPPPPFDAFTSADLSGWNGDKSNAEYQRLLATLRAAVTPDTPTGVKADDDGALVVEAITHRGDNSSETILLTADLQMIRDDQLENIERLQSTLIGALNAEPQDIVAAYRTAVQQDPLDISELNARFSDVSELLEPFSIHRFSTELHRLTETHDELVFELKQLIDSATTS